jgi:hypothetical protein
MKFAYISTDEVNQNLAVQIADEYHIAVCPVSYVDARQHDRFDALLYDWDSLSWLRRNEICVASLASGLCPVGVHGFSFDNERAETLHQDGIAVFRRLDANVFRTLRCFVKRTCTASRARRLHSYMGRFESQ